MTINKSTLEQALRELDLAYKECYLRLQKALLNFLYDTKDEDERREYLKTIRELGKTYLKATATKKLYCKYCKKWVERGRKDYGEGIDSRAVCGGGCNTDWSRLIEWSKL